MPVTLKEFESVFPSLVDEVANHVRETGLPQSQLDWLVKVTHILKGTSVLK